MIKLKQLISLGCDQGNATRHYDSLCASMEQYNITTPERIAAFFANVIHETQYMKRFTENLNYSADGLLRTWPHRFTREESLQFDRKPELIANKVYAGRMGNTEPGDGWKFRGRGMFMTTGRQGYLLAGKTFGVDFIAEPELMTCPPYAAKSAAYYWNLNRLNIAADRQQLRAIRVAINGGLIGFDEVKKLYEKLLLLCVQ